MLALHRATAAVRAPLRQATRAFSSPPTKESKHFDATLTQMPVSLSGKVVAITGCTSGTGKILAETVAKRGGSVLMLNRPSSRAVTAFDAVKRVAADENLVKHVDCDMQSFDSVRSASDEIASAGQPLDVLVNNAGVMALSDTATVDGYDVQMQTNHLSHFLLTAKLWPLLLQAATQHGDARVVNHSSVARHYGGKLDAKYYGKNGGNLGGDEEGFFPMTGGRWDRYGQSKKANIAFTLALHDRIVAAGPDAPCANVRALCAHPGYSSTNLQVTASQDAGGSSALDRFTAWVSQSAEDGTLGIIRCTMDPSIPSGSLVGPAETIGRFLGMRGPAEVLPAAAEHKLVPAGDRDILWRVSSEATGATDFFPSI